eukprot:GHVS01094437.1.p1 GENE.GHVS01094437.1~~GHVS01094437.1.p1  ORF type:complete len:621 (+),score=102.36 GHVS01094437.1:124-1986(+)
MAAHNHSSLRLDSVLNPPLSSPHHYYYYCLFSKRTTTSILLLPFSWLLLLYLLIPTAVLPASISPSSSSSCTTTTTTYSKYLRSLLAGAPPRFCGTPTTTTTTNCSSVPSCVLFLSASGPSFPSHANSTMQDPTELSMIRAPRAHQKQLVRRRLQKRRLNNGGGILGSRTHSNNHDHRRSVLCAGISGLTMKAMRPKVKVLLTGLGVVNGVGVGIESFWKNLLAGRNVVDKVKSFDATGMNCAIGCEINPEDFDPKEWFKDIKEIKRNDKYTNFAVAASKMALQDAGVDTTNGSIRPERFGVVVGSGIGGLGFMEREFHVMQERGHKKVSPYLIPAMISNTAPGLIAIENNAKGPNHGVVSACATAGHAIGVAMRYIENGEADIMICGGSEASITPLSFAGFNSLRAMCTGYNDNPKKGSRPFDKNRAGFVMGEGAGILLLESEEHAIRRGAHKVYGEAAGYGANADAHHITAPSPGGVGLAECLKLAIADAEVAPEDIAYINAHGTSTPYNDKAETAAYKKVFGEEGARKLHISSTKSMTGHCLGAAAGIEACVAAKVLETGVCPPTINYEVPDPECDLNYCPNEAVTLKEKPTAVLSDTLGFGGHNAVTVFKRYTRPT